MNRFRWGILATGNIAHSMAEALALVPEARLLAIASRRQASADKFAAKFNIPRSYGSYDALLNDADIDIVYIATPNARHKDTILAALGAGKHVLCEKPLTLSPTDSAECAAAARTAGRFLMEAMWTAFFPAMQKAVSLVAHGAIGTPCHLAAQFVSHRDPDEWPNLFDPALGGGASLDLGIYPIAAARLLAGEIVSSRAETVYGSSGVDEMVAMSLRHRNGVLSQLSFGFRVDMPISLRLTGDAGAIEIAENFHCPTSLILERPSGRENIHLPAIGRGYAHEVIEAHNCISRGAIESDSWSHSATIAVAKLIADVTSR